MCIFHEMLSVRGVTMEEGIAIVALAGHETRPAFLNWFGENPNSAKTAPIVVLDSIAKHRDTLLKGLLAIPIDSGNGSRALALVRSALGTNPVSARSPDPTPARSCCGN